MSIGTLRHGVRHIPGTAAPWGAGNVALAGHRDTFFRGLSQVRLNDVIELETLRGTFKYRVERITVLGPQDSEVLRSPEWDLTLGDVLPVPLRWAGTTKVHRVGYAAEPIGEALASLEEEIRGTVSTT